jgi:hypothetical protein
MRTIQRSRHDATSPSVDARKRALVARLAAVDGELHELRIRQAELGYQRRRLIYALGGLGWRPADGRA